MKKRINTDAIKNELAGSVFFPQAEQESPFQEQPPDSVIPRYHATMPPRNHETTTLPQEESIEEKVRKAVKQIGKEAATHRFTLAEKNALADIEYRYKRQGIRTSENEITRIAMNSIVEEYRQNGENSMLAKLLKR